MNSLFAWLRSRLIRGSAKEANGTPGSKSTGISSDVSTGAASRLDLEGAVIQFNLGNEELARNRHDVAERHYRRALELNPGFAEAYANLGALLRDLGQSDEAEGLLLSAVQCKPDQGQARFNLAMLYIDQVRWTDAATQLKRLLAADPSQADAQYWLGNALLMGEGDAAGARAAYHAAVGLAPNFLLARWGEVIAQLPVIPQSQAEQFQAPALFARELERFEGWLRTNPSADGDAAVGVQLPFYLAYIAQNHREILTMYGSMSADLVARWSQKVGVAAPVGSGGAKCRLGIVSAHIQNHSVWHALLRGWIEHLDRDKFELHIFYTGSKHDAETEWASRRVAKLHHGQGSWIDWAKVISACQADVLIYPEIGMDATSVRLSLLRLAKVQLASWGHPISTGLPTIDGFITAQALEPPECSTHYSEKLIVLPRLGCCYQPFGTQPTCFDISIWGIQPDDRILLCAGAPYKYAPEHDAIWAEISRRCQPCKLIFFRGPTESLAAQLEQRLRASFARLGVSFDDSVRFIPWQSQPEFFALLDRADVYLDSIGFSGFNTTMQAIERGTPVVAFEGEFMRGRFASAILRQIGLDKWVAGSTDQYIALVETLVSDAKERQQARDQIVERRQELFDDRETVVAIEKVLQALCEH